MQNNFKLLARSYDFRWIYPTEINFDYFYTVGHALAAWAPAGSVTVGGDARLSTPELKKAMIQGLVDSGRNVIDIGLVSSDMLQFSTIAFSEEVALGVMITASHNPKEYNGFKCCLKNAVPANLKQVAAELEDIINKGFVGQTVASRSTDASDPEGASGSVKSGSVKSGSVEKRDLLPLWIERVAQFAMSDMSHLRVVADGGNGTAGVFMQALADRLGFELIPLFLEPDGNFPNHHPSPIESKNMQHLIAKVRETRADIGVAFDGDADRAIFCDGTGTIISASISFAAIAELFLIENPGKKVVHNTVTGKIVQDTIAKHGGMALQEYVGHVYIKQRMSQDPDIVFAGEHSSHFFFPSLGNMDSGLVAFVMFLEYMSQFELTAQEVREKFSKYHSIEETNFRVRNTKEVLDFFAREYSDAAQESWDGLTVSYPNWWFNLRPSSGEPLVRLNLEADSSERLNEQRTQILSQIANFSL